MRLHAPDAVAVAGFIEPELLSHLRSMNRPVVLIDLRAPGFRSVNVDNARGAALAMQHLFALGRKRIAFIGGSLAHYSISQRAMGYRLAYFEAGLLFNPTLEVTTQPAIDADLAAADAMERLIAQARAQFAPMPYAVFAYNDAAASLPCASVSRTVCGYRKTSRLSVSTIFPPQPKAHRRSPRSRSTRKRWGGAAWNCCWKPLRTTMTRTQPTRSCPCA